MSKRKRGYPRCPSCGRVYRTQSCHYCRSQYTPEQWEENTRKSVSDQLGWTLFFTLIALAWWICSGIK